MTDKASKNFSPTAYGVGECTSDAGRRKIHVLSRPAISFALVSNTLRIKFGLASTVRAQSSLGYMGSSVRSLSDKPQIDFAETSPQGAAVFSKCLPRPIHSN
jgi:hypothetical protein